MSKKLSGWKCRRTKTINGKIMYHYRWVMEQHLGRKLKDAEVVHHINGNRTDDRIENLMLMPSQGAHQKLERPLGYLIEVTCGGCGGVFMGDTRRKVHFCSRECWRKNTTRTGSGRPVTTGIGIVFEATCSHCGNKFRRKGNPKKMQFCNKECYSIWSRGRKRNKYITKNSLIPS